MLAKVVRTYAGLKRAHFGRKRAGGGVMANLHMCMNHKKQMIPCDHLHIGMKYDEHLISAIMEQLPRFVHKHLVVYKMYTVLKLYYLHQQELLNQVLAILKEHIHSAELAATMRTYIGTMQGANFGWISKIQALLKANIKMYTGDMEKLVVHHRLVHHLHTIVYNAAAHNHAKINKMFSLMRRHGFAKYSLRSRHHLFKRSRAVFHRIRHVFRKHTVRKVHTRVVRSYSFRSTTTTKRTVRHMVRRMGYKKTVRVLKRVLVKAHSKKTIRHVKKAIAKVVKKAKKAKAAKKVKVAKKAKVVVRKHHKKAKKAHKKHAKAKK